MFPLAMMGDLAKQAEELKTKTTIVVQEFRDKVDKLQSDVDKILSNQADILELLKGKQS